MEKRPGGQETAAGDPLPTEELATFSFGGSGRAWSLLIFERDASWSIQLPADGAVRIGRAPDVDVRLSDRGVSARHATIAVTGGRVLIQDLGSTNGTRVN